MSTSREPRHEPVALRDLAGPIASMRCAAGKILRPHSKAIRVATTLDQYTET